MYYTLALHNEREKDMTEEEISETVDSICKVLNERNTRFDLGLVGLQRLFASMLHGRGSTLAQYRKCMTDIMKDNCGYWNTEEEEEN